MVLAGFLRKEPGDDAAAHTDLSIQHGERRKRDAVRALPPETRLATRQPEDRDEVLLKTHCWNLVDGLHDADAAANLRQLSALYLGCGGYSSVVHAIRVQTAIVNSRSFKAGHLEFIIGEFTLGAARDPA